MDKTSIAEWMLARRLGPQRAAEIAGDLLEQHSPAQTNRYLLKMALGLRAGEFWGVLLACLLVQLLQNLLFSAWQLRVMARLEDAHIGWAWSLFSLLAMVALCSWLTTAISALRLGVSHRVTRVSLIASCTLSVVSVFMLHPVLRQISPVLITLVVLWQFHATGWLAVSRALAAFATAYAVVYSLVYTVQRAEIRSCVVNMHTYSHGGWPAWSVYYAQCAPLATHNLLMLFLAAVAALWTLTFTESHARPGQLTSPQAR